MASHEIFSKLRTLREYALAQGARAHLEWKAEDSHLVRYANSTISLNTNEHLTILEVTVYGDHKSASTTLIVDENDLDTIKATIDKAIEMLAFATPLTYQPTLPSIEKTSVFEETYDPEVEALPNEDIIAFVNEATKGLETDDIMLSGNFSSGVATYASISTETPEVVFSRKTDIGITLVLSSEKRKWEVNAEQFVSHKRDLDAQALHDRLSWLVKLYTTLPEERLHEGPYRVVLGPAATAEYLSFLGWVGYSASTLKRGLSAFKEDDVGKKVLSEQFTLIEDPSMLATFPSPVDAFGRRREKRAIFDRGVLTGFLWSQQTADEFGGTATGHDVSNLSIALQGGDVDTTLIQDFACLPRDRDILYVPYLHYANIVNPTEGLVTGVSRFGALYLKRDGTITLPYNVRFTERLDQLFGDKLVWLSKELIPYGSSSSYFGRDPSTTLVPALACFDGVTVEISNENF
jgi:predicted Zn-dependent protease